MTRNPVSVTSSTLATVALNKMVKGHFRHLPVLEEHSASGLHVSGMLGSISYLLPDITKCLIEALSRLERMNASSLKLTEAIDQVNRDFPTQQSRALTEFLVSKLSVPDLSGLMDATPPIVKISASVLQACKIMATQACPF